MVTMPAAYNDGTASVVAGSTAVTGQAGTAWMSVLRPGYLFGGHKGLGVRILSVNSDTSLTLAYGWPGPTQVAAAYEVQIVSDAVEMQERTRQMLDELRNGNLYALAGLPSAADTVPYFTGAGTAALADQTAFARALIAAGNTAAAYTALGEIPNPQIPARLQQIAPRMTAANALDNVNVGGWVGVYGGDIATVNGPSGAGNGACLTLCLDTDRRVQTYYAIGGTSDRIWMRRRSDGAWTTWMQVGMPERGSNANGEYVRFADGTQICWPTTGLLTSGPVTTASGPLFTTANIVWIFPAAFASSPEVMPSKTGASSRWITVVAAGATNATLRVFSSVTIATDVAFGVVATGRWY